MLAALHRSLKRHCFIGGATHAVGWGAVVKENLLPTLDHPKLRHHAQIIKEGLDRAPEPITTFVVGEGKFGKSSLINALVGYEVAEVDFLPKTWHVTRYIPKGTPPKFEIHFDHTTDAASRFERTCLTMFPFLNKQNGIISLNDASQLERLLHEEEAITKQGSAWDSPIRQVVKSIPTNANGRLAMEIVDTPGILQQQTGGIQTHSIDDFYHRADVVLWVVAADKITSRQSMEYLRSMNRYRKPIILVITRADTIPKSDISKVLNRASDCYGEFVEELCLVSSTLALQGRAISSQNLLEESGLPHLESCIEHLVIDRGRETKILSLWTTCLQATKEAASILQQEASSLQENLEKYNANLAEPARLRTIGSEILSRETAGLIDTITRAAKIAMRTHANYSESDNGPPFSEYAVERDIRNVMSKYADVISNHLQRELAYLQDIIISRPYLDNAYSANAKINAQERRVSFQIKTQEVMTKVNVSGISINYGFIDFIGEVLTDARNFIFGLIFEGSTAMGEVKKGRIEQRKRLLEKYIEAASQISPGCNQGLRDAVEGSIETSIQNVKQEVTRCFQEIFTDKNLVIARIHKLHKMVEEAKVPPPIMYTATQMLKKTLDNQSGNQPIK